MSEIKFERKIKQIETILKQLTDINSDNEIMCNEIIDLLGDLTSYHEDLESDKDSLEEERDDYWNQLEDKAHPYDSLKKSIERYNTGVKSEQENIIKILDDEFNLSLVCL